MLDQQEKYRPTSLSLAIFLLVFSMSICIILIDDKRREVTEQAKETEYIPSPSPTPSPIPTPSPTPIPNPMKNYYKDEIRAELENISVSARYMVFEYIGDYYITAYCPEECGYRVYSDGSDNFPNGWITATGTICHREDEWWNPSTCGINTKVNDYGDIFLIDGKVYIAEDTGYVTGNWIDLFMPSYEQMMTHGSHWTDVYSVSYEETEAKAGHYDINDYIGCPYGRR